MFLTKWLELTWGSADSEIILGLHSQAFDGYPVDEDNKPITGEEPLRIYRFTLGLLFFNINIYYR